LFITTPLIIRENFMKNVQYDPELWHIGERER